MGRPTLDVPERNVVVAVLRSSTSIRHAAKSFGVCDKTLSHWCKILKITKPRQHCKGVGQNPLTTWDAVVKLSHGKITQLF